jgi:hypothetical protein
MTVAQPGPALAPTPGAHWDRLISSIDNATAQLSHISHQLDPPVGLFAQMHWPDWIQALLLVVAIIALLFTRGSLKEASKARDIENYYNILGLFSSGFERFAAACEADKYIEFLALVNLFESTCDLYNRRLFGAATSRMLRSYLSDILPQLWTDTTAQAWIAKAQTGPSTFNEIKTFAKREKLKGVPHG